MTQLAESTPTQEAIIDEPTFERVQELRQSRRRSTASERTSLFSRLVHCADCGAKMYFAAGKRRIKELDMIIFRFYEDNSLGKLSEAVVLINVNVLVI